MVRSNERDYEKEDVIKVLRFINEKEPVKINDIIFSLGPDINTPIENAVKTLVDENIIGSRDSFLKTHVNFNPWDTITYDGIADKYIGVDENDMLYLKNKSRKEYDIPSKRVMSD
jgi:hypothetical protein